MNMMHIHVLVLHRHFELIPIKIRFLQIFKIARKSSQKPCTIVQGLWGINDKERFIIFSDAYTWTYVG